MCLCEYTAFTARWITAKEAEKEYLEYLKVKAKSGLK